MSEPPDAPRVVRSARPRGNRALLIISALCLAVGAAAMGFAFITGRSEELPSPQSADEPAPGTPVLSARRVPAFTTAPIPLRALAAAVQPFADAAPPESCISVGDGSRAIYSHNASAGLVPASNQKLITASAALDLIGADETLKTDFRTVGKPDGGVIEGDLFMVGGGDPLLMTDAYQDIQTHGRLPESNLEAIADQLVGAGVRRVTGSVVGDGSRYDSERVVEGWPSRWLTNGTGAPLSALSVNDGWLIDPVTGEGEGGATADPSLHAAAVMTRLLTDRGVVIDGAPRSGEAPADTESLLAVDSLPLSEILEELLAFSDNTTAELLLKEMGVRSGAAGTTADGVAAVTAWASDRGLPEGEWVMVDGSGLSDGNRVTCDLLGAVLRTNGATGTIADALAVPGQGGTLSDRFEEGEWPQRLRAKTGSLNDVTSLSGWLTTRPGAALDFEIVLNTGDRRVGNSDLGLQEDILTALLDQPVAPPLDAAGPRLPAA